MIKLTIFGHSLTLAGLKKSLPLADLHNNRRISAENGAYGDIDPSRSHLNVHLVSSGALSYVDAVKKHLIQARLDLNHFGYKKKNRGYAVEFLFTVTAGHQCDFESMYRDCLDWLKSYHPECPIVHAIIHFDEGTPHMHVILVPLFGGQLQADKIKGYKGKSQARNKALFKQLDKKYGLTFPKFLKGHEKQVGAEMALNVIKTLTGADIRNLLIEPLTFAVHARPEGFLHTLGISYEDVVGYQRDTRVLGIDGQLLHKEDEHVQPNQNGSINRLD